MRVTLDLNSVEGYRQFIAIKSLPTFRFRGREATFPDEYASRVAGTLVIPGANTDYRPIDGLFDYQEAVARLAIHRQKFAVFARPGLGKTLIMTEYCRHVRSVIAPERKILITSPLMVIKQTIGEIKRFYHDRGIELPIEQIKAKDLAEWTQTPGDNGVIGITNYEALSDRVERGYLAALASDETSIMKSHYGKTGERLIRLGSGLDWKLCLTGTPAPNDRIEYANHAVHLDSYPTINAFLARFFVNRGQTGERWELKSHALAPFYRALSHWCIFLNNPATYGWKDNVGTIPPVNVHIHNVDLTDEQKELVVQKLGTWFVGNIGGITKRSTLSQISKGSHKGKKIETNKPAFIRGLVDSWPSESTLIWCRYNAEQDELAKWFPEAGSISGDTPHEKRVEIIEDFQAGKIPTIISKPEILSLGLNLQIATRQVFSSCEDSYEDWVQAIARSNRVGSTKELNVHLPLTDVEMPMFDNILRKSRRVDADMVEQEQLFRGNYHAA